MVRRTSLAFSPAVLPESPVLPGLKSSSALVALPNRLGIFFASSMAVPPSPQAASNRGRSRAVIGRSFMAAVRLVHRPESLAVIVGVGRGDTHESDSSGRDWAVR